HPRELDRCPLLICALLAPLANGVGLGAAVALVSKSDPNRSETSLEVRRCTPLTRAASDHSSCRVPFVPMLNESSICSLLLWQSAGGNFLYFYRPESGGTC